MRRRDARLLFSWEGLMKFRAKTFAVLMAFAAGTSLAHGNKVHVLGTLEKINADSVVVKTKEGKSVEVKLVASTVYLLHVTENPAKTTDANENKPAKISDLAVGDLVVIHATPKESSLEADEIKFSIPTAPKAAAPGTPKPKS
jgi:hypothetical protein